MNNTRLSAGVSQEGIELYLHIDQDSGETDVIRLVLSPEGAKDMIEVLQQGIELVGKFDGGIMSSEGGMS